MNEVPPPNGPEDYGVVVPFDREEVAAGPPRHRREMVIEWFDDAARSALAEPNNPLIDGLFDESAMSVIYGDSNSGKTFIALNMAFHVSKGLDWNGRKVKYGLIVYVAAEGGSKIKRRLAALQACQGDLSAPPLFALVRYPIDLRSNDANLKQLIALIKGAEQAASTKCVWIIVDTLSRAMAGGDENSPVDMGRIVTAADKIRDETKAHFSFVHHTGKDAARGARGHSLLRAATDTEIEIADGVLTATKQRDMESGLSLGFSLVDIEIGEDGDGKPLRSAIVDWTGHAGQRGQDRTEKNVPAALRLLMETAALAIEEAGEEIRPFANGPIVRAAPETAMRRRYYAKIAETADEGENQKALGERQRKAFGRAIKTALDRKLIIAAPWKDERWLWLP